MTAPSLRAMREDDAAHVMALNADVAELTSPMDQARFDLLFAASALKMVAEREGDLLGFVFAIADDSAYENANLSWFLARIRSFLYVDRIVVSAQSRGLGVGQLLYRHTFESAAKSGAFSVCAEIDLEPPNEASLRFHERAGFLRIGQRATDTGRVLSMQLRPLSGA